MKLHLPKLLLTAVLAACVTPSAWAGWGTGTEANTFYYTGSETSLNTSNSSGDITYLKPNGATEGTIGTVTIAENDKLIITGKWNSTAASDNFSGLTISSVVGDANRVLEIGAHQSNDDSIIGNQTVTINNGKETYGVAHTIVNTGATLNFSSTTDAINHNKTMVMDVSGTVDFGTARQTVGNFTLNLISGTITGSNKVGSAGDDYGAIDFKENITGKITSTGTSSITGGVRLRTGITIDVAEESVLTIDAITKTGGITKTGSGTLTITLANTYNEDLYTGNTTLKDSGTIEYAVAGTTTYTGTISGSGNITMSGSGSMTLSKVNNLDGDISVTNGSLTINAMDVSKTMGVSVTQGKTLNIGSVTVDALNHKLDLISKTGDSYYTNDGSSQTTNGFMWETATYRLFDGYVWNGSVTGYTVGEQDGDTTLSTNGAGTVYYVNEGTHTVSTAGDYINGRATRYFVDGGATLKIDGNQSDGMTAADILTTSTGAGNIELTTDVTLAAGSSTSVGGTLSVSNATIKVDTTGTHNDIKVLTTSLASFNKVSLDGATIEYLGATSELQNVTVGTAGANLKFKDMAETSSEFKLTGTTLLNGNLTIGQTTGDAWKYTVHISKLTGSGDISLSSTATSGQTGEKGKLIIDSLQGYTGAISVTKNVGPALLTATTGGAVSLKGITLASGAEGTVITTGNAGLGNVSLSGGASLDIWKKSASLTTTISSLSVTGSATVGTERHSSCHNGTFNISSLSNTGDSATLTLKNGSQTDSATVFNLSGSSALKGTINIQSDSYRGDDNDDNNQLNMKRKLQVNLNSVEVASKAVINFQDASDTTGKNGEGSANNVRANYNILGVGVDGAKVAALSGTTTNAATVKSSTEDTTRTLEITGSGNNTTNATVENSVKLLMSGSGQQTFTGTVNASAITVTAGELVFNNAVSVAEVSVTGGTLTVGTYDGTGSLTSEQSLTATSKATFGAGAVVNANLVLSSGATVTMAEALTMGSTVTLGTGMTLSGDLVNTIKTMSKDGAVDLFTGVDALYLGDSTVASATLDATSGVNLSEYFDFDGASNYYLGYNGTNVFAGVIPEPTTATLSLLALAGLAARRRRK